MNSSYDLIIIGGGPGGLTAGIYASRARINSLLIERGAFGGLITEAEMVENFPGFPEGISGMELGQLLHKQATRFGLKTSSAEVTGLKLVNGEKVVQTGDGDFTARAVIVASGSDHQKLNAPGEKEFSGKGVSYCATCDGAFFQDMPVAIVGGGDTALSEALYLSKLAAKVYVIHRRNQLRATHILQEKASAEPKIELVLDSVVEQITGGEFVEQLELRNVKTGEKSSLKLAGIFVSVGIRPNTDFVEKLLSLDDAGYVITNDRMETSIEGIFAVGDVRRNSGRQAIIAAGDGATAAIYAEKYLNG